MEHARRNNLNASANNAETTSYTEYMNWYNDEELVEMPSERERERESDKHSAHQLPNAWEQKRVALPY